MKKEIKEYIDQNLQGEEYKQIQENGYIVYDELGGICGSCVTIIPMLHAPGTIFEEITTGRTYIAQGGNAIDGAERIQAMND